MADSEEETADSTRLERTTACLPIVHGSVATFLGRKADELQTHQWNLYLRGPNNEDLSPVISKVIFQLHASFAQPVREFTAPPYEVTEKGWGEFEANIRIVWKDPQEKTTMVSHMIRLYQPGAVTNAVGDKPVVAETYEEVVFTNPNEKFLNSLQEIRQLPPITEYTMQEHFQKFSDAEDMECLLEAQKFLSAELKTVKARLKALDDESVQIEEAFLELDERSKQEAASSRTSSAKRPRPR